MFAGASIVSVIPMLYSVPIDIGLWSLCALPILLCFVVIVYGHTGIRTKMHASLITVAMVSSTFFVMISMGVVHAPFTNITVIILGTSCAYVVASAWHSARLTSNLPNTVQL